MNREELLEGMETKWVLFGTFFAFHNRLQTTGDSFFEEITCKQFFLIICLGLFGEKVPTIKELAEVMGSSHQNVKQLVLKLQDKGFLQLFTDENDRRKTRIRMTEACQTLAQKYNEREHLFMKLLYQGIDKDNINTTIETLLQFKNKFPQNCG